MLTRMDLMFGGGRYTTILKGHGLFKMGETLNQFKLSLKVAKFLLQTRVCMLVAIISSIFGLSSHAHSH